MKKWLWPALAGLLWIAAVMPSAMGAESVEVSDLKVQMKRVLENQEKILASLEEIKKELQIIKIRASLK